MTELAAQLVLVVCCRPYASTVDVALPALEVVAAGALIPLVAFPVLRGVGKLPRADQHPHRGAV